MDQTALDQLAAVAVALSQRVPIYRDVIADVHRPPLARIYRGSFVPTPLSTNLTKETP